MVLDNMLSDRLSSNFTTSSRFFGGAESYGMKKTEEVESKIVGGEPPVPMESPAATGRKRKKSPVSHVTGDASATSTTTPITAVAPVGTNYTTMALYVLGGGAIGYGAAHFGLKDKEIAGLKGLHLNLACAAIGAIGGYFFYNQTANS